MPTSLLSPVKMGARRLVVEHRKLSDSLEALYRFVDALPTEPGAAIVIVRPRTPNASCPLPEALARYTNLSITEVREPTPIELNRVYLSPPGRPLVLRRNRLVPAKKGHVEGPISLVHVLQSPQPSLPLAVQGADRDCSARTGPDPRVGRLETELRETQKELRGMVQKYEATQRRLRAANETLQSQNELLEERTEQVAALSEALTEAEENERQRLGRVLHDDLQQVLYAVRAKLDLLDQEVGLEKRQEGLLGRALEMLDEGIDTTRTLASGLNPPIEGSLWDTLEWLTVRMQEVHGLSVEMRAVGTNPDTDKALRTLVVRLVRELLFNIVKHAGVDTATLQVVEREDRLYVAVEDRGTGFDPAILKEDPGGLGLHSLQRRVKMIGGTVEVDAAPGEGTRVMLEVPHQLDPTAP